MSILTTIYRQQQFESVKKKWTAYRNTTLTKKQAMLRMRKAIKRDPTKYVSIDGVAHFF